MSVVPEDLVIVFARVPALGRVKTRLAAALGEPATLEVYRRLLEDTLSMVAGLSGVARQWCWTGGDEQGEGAALATRHGFATVPQGEGDLGERMARALAQGLKNHARVVLIGADCPPIDREMLIAAFQGLRNSDLVVGPTEDGGYGLIGSRVACGPVFQSIAWSSPEVMAQTRARASEAGFSLSELSLIWDVDTLADWERWRQWKPLRRTWLSAAAGWALLVGMGLRSEPALAAAEPEPAVARSPGQGGQPLAIPPFSTSGPGVSLPAGWQEQRLSSVEPNRYQLVADPSGTVLMIESRRSASSLVHRLPGGATPTRLSWRWRTDGWPAASGDFGSRSGDDFSLRLYLMFDYPLARVPLGQRLALTMARTFYRSDLPAASLCYVADHRVPAETLQPSPYTSRVQVLVARSAREPGDWWLEDRDLQADFQRAFGREYGPGMPPVVAVALAADTDQGGGSLRAWFSDLRWSSAR